jgi:hypothetical protein
MPTALTEKLADASSGISPEECCFDWPLAVVVFVPAFVLPLLLVRCLREVVELPRRGGLSTRYVPKPLAKI